MAGTEKSGIRPKQFRGKQAAEDSFRGAVQIGQQAVQQPRALNQSFTNNVPLLGGNQQGNEIEAPRPVEPVRIAVDIVGDAVLVNQASGKLAPLAEFLGLEFIEHRDKFLPVRTQRPVRLHHFIGERGIDSVIVGEVATNGAVRLDAARGCGSLHMECDSYFIAILDQV